MINPNKKRLLVEFHSSRCEQCKEKFSLGELVIHRIKRGCEGGTYECHRNLKVLCKDCHKKTHAGEF